MWTLIVVLIIIIVITWFGSLNNTMVSLNFFFWKAPEVSLALIVFCSVLSGVMMALLFAIPEYIKNMKKIKGLESKVKTLESGEIKNEKTQS
ncbi:MAG: LapA family protein [Candidatus Saganbacteria bacterium]|nr:LapA family protein [Candidatus Saganbacteria bacterium]